MRARNSSGISGKEEAGRIKRGDRAMRRLWWVGLIMALCATVTKAAPTFSDRAFGGDPLNPGDDEIVVQVIRVVGDSTRDATIEFVHIRNVGNATSAQIPYIYLVWDSSAPTSAVYTQSPSLTIDVATNNLQVGVIKSTNFTVPKGSMRFLWVLVKVAEADKIEDEATVSFETNLYWYSATESGNSGFIADTRPEVIRKAGFEEIQDDSPESNNLNPGDTAPVQRFTARDRDANNAEIKLSKIIVCKAANATANESDISMVKVTVTYGTNAYVQTNSSTGWDTTGGGIVFNNFSPPLPLSFPDGSQISVLVEMTVAQGATDGRTIATEVVLETVENGQTTSITIASPRVWTIRRAGPEEAEELSTPPVGLGINPGERLTQRIWVADRDYNGNKFQITHLWIKNLGTAETADIAGLTVWIGNTQLYSGWPPASYDFRTGGWIPVTSWQVNDEGEATLTIEYRISPLATTGRTLKPEVRIGSYEPPVTSPGQTPSYATPTLVYPASVTIYPAGFEAVENVPIEPTTVYSTQRFVAQKIKLQDSDANTSGITITRIRVKNIGTSLDSQFVKLEVRLAGSNGALLAETANLAGFRTTGVTLTPTANNTVADDTATEIWIWLTLAGPENTVAGRNVRLETIFSFTEGTVSGDTPARQGTSFDIGINNPPVVQDFTWTPTSPQYGQDVTFTPGTITDPDGDAIVYSKWDFGEGAYPRYVERNGPPQSATTKYPDGGTFNVSLLVRDAKGLEGTKAKTITVTLRPNTPPTVDFSWTPTEPSAGQSVTFVPTVTDPDTPPDTPFTYSWTFGTNATPSTSTAQTPSVVFTATGTYTVRLEVTDRRGAKGTKEKSITIAALPQQLPTVTSLSASPTYPTVGQTVTFTATATTPANDPVTMWKWDFGDGTAQEVTERATTLSLTHIYQNVGTYTVNVQARNSAGWSEARSIQIVVHPAGVEFGTVVLDNPVTGNQCRIQIFAPAGATDLKITILDQAGRPVILDKPVALGTFTWDLK
ncbi:MAG: PKD domain-containing protein, partial [Candidatus Methanomethyliaceae archaeon]